MDPGHFLGRDFLRPPESIVLKTDFFEIRMFAQNQNLFNKNLFIF